jgi:hypothetical protein
MTARAEVVAALDAAMPADVVVLPYSRQIDPPSQSTVMVRIDTVAPSAATGGARDYTFALVLIAAQVTPGPADDELDDLLEDVLAALDDVAASGLRWTEATRAVYAQSNPAYEVTVTATTTTTTA